MVKLGTTPAQSGTTVSPRALNRAFLARQMLLDRQKVSALDAIERLVGLQAQVARPPFVGLWTRLQSFSRSELATALHDRRAVRVTAMFRAGSISTSADAKGRSRWTMRDECETR